MVTDDASDAVHLATAIRLRADFLISNDNGFFRAHGETVDGVKVIKPEIVWQETLEDSADDEHPRVDR